MNERVRIDDREHLLPSHTVADAEHFSNPRAKLVQTFALLAGPLAWFLGLNVDYLLIRSACSSELMLPLHLVTMLTLAIAAAGGVVSAREWRRAGAHWPEDRDGPVARTRFIAVIGLISAAYFALVIVAEWLTKLFLSPCMAI